MANDSLVHSLLPIKYYYQIFCLHLYETSAICPYITAKTLVLKVTPFVLMEDHSKWVLNFNTIGVISTPKLLHLTQALCYFNTHQLVLIFNTHLEWSSINTKVFAVFNCCQNGLLLVTNL